MLTFFLTVISCCHTLIGILLVHLDSLWTSAQNNPKNWIEGEFLQTLEYFHSLWVMFNMSAVNGLKQQGDGGEQSGCHEVNVETCTWRSELRAVQPESTRSTLLPQFCLHSKYYFTERNNINKTVDNRTTLSYNSQLDWKAQVEKTKERTHEALHLFSSSSEACLYYSEIHLDCRCFRNEGAFYKNEIDFLLLPWNRVRVAAGWAQTQTPTLRCARRASSRGISLMTRRAPKPTAILICWTHEATGMKDPKGTLHITPQVLPCMYTI